MNASSSLVVSHPSPSASAVQTLSLPWLENDGSCWTCVARRTFCDKGLPDCQTCIRGGFVCEGYSTRLHWKTSVHDRPKSVSASTLINGDGPQIAGAMSPRGQWDQRWPGYRPQSSLYTGWIPEDPIIATSTTPLERRYLRHFLAHVCRVTPAIDEPSNALRNVFLPMAATDPALLNTILAVSSQHLGTWQRRPDPLSATYFAAALSNLRKNLANPQTAGNPSTIATTFMLASHEIFNASTSQWRNHLSGAAKLIRWRGGAADIHPDIKCNLFMLDLQSALNVGDGFFFDSEQWMQDEVEGKRRELDERTDWPISAVEPGRREACIIDPILGISTKLVSVMAKAARLYQFSRTAKQTGINTSSELLSRGHQIQAELREISLEGVPLSAPLITYPASHRCGNPLGISSDKAMMGDSMPLDPTTQEDLDEGFRLLSKVPDAHGPGSMLGWAITVMGCELPSSMEEEREYLRCRWNGLHGLGLKHSLRAAELLEEVWRRKDRANETGEPLYPRFQDVSRDLGWELVLI